MSPVRIVLLLLCASFVACSNDAVEGGPGPTPGRGLDATATPEASAGGATRTPAPAPTPEFVDAIFCEHRDGDAYVFERCPPGSGGNGFVTRLHVSDEVRFPIGTRVPWCVVREDGDGETWRAIVDEPCAYQGLMTEGLRPRPALTAGITTCTQESVLGGSPPDACVFPGYPQVLARDEAVAFMRALVACGAELAAIAYLRDAYEPVIQALHALQAGSGSLEDLRAAAEPVVAYEFAPELPDAGGTGVRRWHADVLVALERAVEGDGEAVAEASLRLSQAHEFFGLGRGCGG